MGPKGPLLAIEFCLTMKLHAVAPGGPPEGQYKKTQQLFCYTSFDSPFRTVKHNPVRRVTCTSIFDHTSSTLLSALHPSDRHGNLPSRTVVKCGRYLCC